jgi:hypothetical protein
MLLFFWGGGGGFSRGLFGIKRMVFGGNRLGDWDNDLTGEEDGYKSYKI